MTSHSEIMLPALRATFGDWVFYSCVMPLEELAARVSYAEEIHQDKALSRLIQRSLEGKRSTQVADYLKKTEQRFFNSLVVATYGGKPRWLEVGNFHELSSPTILDKIEPSALDMFGFLALSGTEKIFAIDGQHRLAGIKKAVADGMDFGTERLPVIFVAHIESERERSRRLFTTLNKTARAVSKRDIISLDEDDTMAIIARRLVESNVWFKSPKIAVIAGSALPKTNRSALTTITNLYDVLKVIFKFKTGKKTDRQLRFFRPTEAQLGDFEKFASDYFKALAAAFPPVKELFSAEEAGLVTQKYRGDHGGHLLFRPAGLEIFTRLAVDVAFRENSSLPDAVSRIKQIPVDLSALPYRGVLWDAEKKTMLLKGRALTSDLLRYVVGLDPPNDLKERYALALGKSRVLPARLKIK